MRQRPKLKVYGLFGRPSTARLAFTVEGYTIGCEGFDNQVMETKGKEKGDGEKGGRCSLPSRDVVKKGDGRTRQEMSRTNSSTSPENELCHLKTAVQ